MRSSMFSRALVVFVVLVAVVLVLLLTPSPDVVEQHLRWPVRVYTNVPGASVTVEFHPVGTAESPPPVTSLADEDGFAGFLRPEGIPLLSRVDVTVTAPGHAPGRTLLAGGEALVRLKKGPAIRGRVIDPEGAPLEGVHLTLTGSGLQTVHQVTTGDGRFALSPITGETVELTAWKPEWRAWKGSLGPNERPLEVRLDRGRTVEGRVVFPDGRPARCAQVHAQSVISGARADADGRYLLRGLPEGRVRVCCGTAFRDVEAGARGVDFEMPHHVVRISLVDEGDRPFVGAEWRLEGTWNGRSAISGGGMANRESCLMVLSGIAADRIRVIALAPGLVCTGGELDLAGPPSFHDMKVVMKPASGQGALDLFVTDQHGGCPSFAVIEIQSNDRIPLPGYSGRQIMLNDSGHAAIAGIPPGRYRLTVSEGPRPFSFEGFLIPCEVPLEIVEGRDTRVDAELERGGRIRATVTGPDGRPVAPESVGLSRNGRAVKTIAFFGPSFRPSPLPVGEILSGAAVEEGTYQLRASAGGAIGSAEVRVRAGQTVRVRLPLEERGEKD